MAIRSKRYVSDYQREGEQLVAICTSCQRTSILSYRELGIRAQHRRTLDELTRALRCRNCNKKVAEVRLARSFVRPPANRH
jgi:DNA-directed RNA polymerase subunit RPC12/RpoP